MVVGKADYTGAEPDVASALGHGGHEHLWRGDDLPARAVVLANPSLVIAEVVQPLDEFDVPFQR